MAPLSIEQKLSLVITGTDCTVSQHLWDVAVNCSIAQDWQLQKLCHQRCCGSRYWCSMWSIVVAHERQWQDDSHRLSMVQNFGTVTDEQATLKLTCWHTVASVVDGAPALCCRSTECQTSSGILNWLQPAHLFIRDAEEQRITVDKQLN